MIRVPPPALTCGRCGTTLGTRQRHHLLVDRSIVCTDCVTRYGLAGDIADVADNRRLLNHDGGRRRWPVAGRRRRGSSHRPHHGARTGRGPRAGTGSAHPAHGTAYHTVTATTGGGWRRRRG